MVSLPSKQLFSINPSTDPVSVSDTPKGSANSRFTSAILFFKELEKQPISSTKASLRSLRSLNSPLCRMSSTV